MDYIELSKKILDWIIYGFFGLGILLMVVTGAWSMFTVYFYIQFALTCLAMGIMLDFTDKTLYELFSKKRGKKK